MVSEGTIIGVIALQQRLARAEALLMKAREALELIEAMECTLEASIDLACSTAHAVLAELRAADDRIATLPIEE